MKPSMAFDTRYGVPLKTLDETCVRVYLNLGRQPVDAVQYHHPATSEMKTRSLRPVSRASTLRLFGLRSRCIEHCVDPLQRLLEGRVNLKQFVSEQNRVLKQQDRPICDNADDIQHSIPFV
jgi:hypothetical protein